MAAFGRINEPVYSILFVINGFHVFGNNFRKKALLLNFAFFFILSTCYLVSLMRGHIIHNRCLEKVELNIF